ncbi:Imm7 family immunity protein [Streptomyces nogalater]
MYEFHGWFGIAESPEEADAGSLEEGVAELRAAIDRIDWATGEVTLKVHNGEYFVRTDGLVNRRRDEAEELDALVHFIARRFPGSWGCFTSVPPTWTIRRAREPSGCVSWPGRGTGPA